jgi:hypothetical protein
MGTPALALLLETAVRPTVRVRAEPSPSELKDSLKRRSYRWSNGSDGKPRSWCVDVDGAALADEIAFLRTEMYLRDVEPRLQVLTGVHSLLHEVLRRSDQPPIASSMSFMRVSRSYPNGLPPKNVLANRSSICWLGFVPSWIASRADRSPSGVLG